MGVQLDSSTDKASDATAADNTLASAGQVPNPDRRRFSRNALAGSAVLLSLGNRSAWGGQTIGCMSIATLNSFDPETGMFISAPAGRPDRDEDLAAEIHRVADAPLFQGKDGGRSSCPDPGSIDSVCLVKGNCP